MMKWMLNIFRRRLPTSYRQRSFPFNPWLIRYGNDDRELIEFFLKMFADAFLIKHGQIFFLCPDDKPIDIYHAFCRFLPVDTLELEIFVKEMQRHYAVSIDSKQLKDLTLGQCYEISRKLANNSMHPTPPLINRSVV
jgi:hypothetical protein